MGAEVIELNPAFNSRNGDEVLRSIEELLVQQARAAKAAIQTADATVCGAGNATHSSPSITPPEPSIEPSGSASSEPLIDSSQQASSSPTSREFVVKSVVRNVIGGLLLAIVVVVVWQIYHDNQSRRIFEALRHSSVIWLSSSFGSARRDSELTAQSSAKSSDQAAQTPTETSSQANEVAELRQQLLAVVNDVAVMRRDVEHLSNKHEQLSRDLEVIQATVQNVGDKVSSLSQPAPTPAPAHGQLRKKAPKLVRAESPRPSEAASIPPTTSPAGMATVTEQPPRPPLPVPSSAEIPSPVH